jgi:hemerythrin-like domain-containing protein
VLKELVEHHADEEEKEMFPRARKLLSKDELSELGKRMQQRKSELLSEARISR